MEGNKTGKISRFRKQVHILFEAGMVIKGLDSLIEFTVGVMLSVLSLQTVNTIIFRAFGDELTERPRDPIISFLFHGFNGLSASSQTFWASILLASGTAKILLVLGLYSGKKWIYPIAAAVFGIFAIFEIRHILHYPSILLGAFTIFDIIFIALILNEYQFKLAKPTE